MRENTSKESTRATAAPAWDPINPLRLLRPCRRCGRRPGPFAPGGERKRVQRFASGLPWRSKTVWHRGLDLLYSRVPAGADGALDDADSPGAVACRPLS